jgi:hypothetical protein
MPGPGALGVFALQHVRDAAGELDDLKAALDVALGVGDHLAVLGREHLGQLVHVGFDEALEVEHDPGAPLRIDQAQTCWARTAEATAASSSAAEARPHGPAPRRCWG